jgi:hypothetical protein
MTSGSGSYDELISPAEYLILLRIDRVIALLFSRGRNSNCMNSRVRATCADNPDCHVGTDVDGIVWCLFGTGGTVGELSLAADVSMSETAYYFASSNDVIFLPRKGQHQVPALLARFKKNSNPIAYSLDLDQSMPMQNWLLSNTDTIRRVAGRCRRAIATHTPISKVALESAGLRLAWTYTHDLDALRDKVSLHRVMLEAQVPTPETVICADSGVMTEEASRLFRRYSRAVLKIGNGQTDAKVTRVVTRKDIESTLSCLAPRAYPVLLQPFEDVEETLNFQYICSPGSTVFLGSSLQLVVLEPEGPLRHCGNIQPAGAIIGEAKLDEHRRVTQLAAEALNGQGYIGLVGIDTIRTSDGRTLVVDLNLRVNASTFLFGLPQSESADLDGRLFSHGLMKNEGDSAKALQELSSQMRRVEQETGCVLDHCFSPYVLPVSNRIAINLMAMARHWETAVAASMSLFSGLEVACVYWSGPNSVPILPGLPEKVARTLRRR